MTKTWREVLERIKVVDKFLFVSESWTKGIAMGIRLFNKVCHFFILFFQGSELRSMGSYFIVQQI